MSNNDWIYFENSNKMIRMSEYDYIEFDVYENADGKVYERMYLRNSHGEVVRIDDQEDVEGFKKNILKLGDLE